MKPIKLAALSILFILDVQIHAIANTLKPAESYSSVAARVCELQKTPLTRCDLYFDYVVADKKLNIVYLSVAKDLDIKARTLLHNTQREWIKFRGAKCDELQDVSGCDNSQCAGVEHDICALELTNIRTEELKKWGDKKFNAKRDFQFDRSYPNVTNK